MDEFTGLTRLRKGSRRAQIHYLDREGCAPALVGVPLMAPAEERVSPAGREVPLARVKVCGVASPPLPRSLSSAGYRQRERSLGGLGRSRRIRDHKGQ